MNQVNGRTVVVTALLLLALWAAAGADLAAAQNFKPEYKLSVVPGPDTAWGMGAQRFADLVRERTGGRVNIKVYYSGQLFAGQQTNEFQLVRTGVADFSFASTINWSPQVPQLNLFSLPFFFESYEELEAVLNGETGRLLEERLAQLGVTVLGWGENGFREFSNSVRPVRRPEDMQGIKARVVGSQIYIDTFRALGANPTAMNWSEALTAFQQGVVDGQENPLTGIYIPSRLWEVHPYVTMWHYTIDPLIIAVSTRVWNTFPEDVRQIIAEVAKEVEVYQRALSRAGLDGGRSVELLREMGEPVEIEDPIAFLEDLGVTVVQLTPEDRAAFRAATQSVTERWTQIIGEDLVRQAEADKAAAR
ncbi:MAG TPA: DctP family TRAP transporter solute-binding subunit [Limnochordales bacterium]|nr:DctP family TRAP transporter solute-binding subunit [Limnochordales bacterium]